MTLSRRGERQEKGARFCERIEVRPMTIALAAVYENNYIVGVSDRLITVEDVQYEPTFQKHFGLTGFVAMLIADDLTVHIEILKEVWQKVGEVITAKPDSLIKVSEVADIYARAYTGEFVKQAERKHLAPFKMNMDSFLEKQETLDANFVTDLTENIRKFKLPGMEAIVTGLDNGGAHIYHIKNGDVTPQDIAGFSAIGAGYWHANSEFMAASHTRASSMEDTIFLAYRAKKRAEIAPNVGKTTDMFIIGPEMPFHIIPDSEIKKLDALYAGITKKHDKEVARVVTKVKKYAEDYYNQYEAERKKASPEGEGQQTASDDDQNSVH